MSKRTREDVFREAIQDGMRKWYDYLAPGNAALQRDIEIAFKERVLVLQKEIILSRITPELKEKARATLVARTRADAKEAARKAVRDPKVQAKGTSVPPASRLNAMLSSSFANASSK